MRLQAEKFRLQRLQNLHQSTRLRVAAEEEHSKKHLDEVHVLMYADEKGFNWTGLEPELALALARAARDTITAEQEVAKLRIKECEDRLETLKNAADDVPARVQDANEQVATLIGRFNREAIRVDLRPQCFKPSFHVPYDPQFHSPSNAELFSLSDNSVSEGDQ